MPSKQIMRTFTFERLGIDVREDGYVQNKCWGRGWTRGTIWKKQYKKQLVIRYRFFSPITRKQYWVHRLVAIAFVKNPNKRVFKCVDHIDGDSENNDASNLRWINQRLNSINQKHALNVTFDKRYRKWCAYTRLNGKQMCLGFFKIFNQAYAIAQAFKELSFNTIYLSHIKKNEREETTSSQYLHGSPESFTLAIDICDSRARRSRCMRRALLHLHNIRTLVDQRSPSFA